MGCGGCRKLGRCVYDDAVNAFRQKAAEADGFVFGAPVHYAHAAGSLLGFMDRLFYSGSADLAYKPAAAVCSARRGGTTASFDDINKFFTINQMPVVSARYWNNVHGTCAEDVERDEEGLGNLRALGRNMAWLLRCIEAADVKGVSHITGGGFYENIPRSLKKGCCARINKADVRTPALFQLMQKTGNISEHDMFNTFNMGVGMVLTVPAEQADKALDILHANGEPEAYRLGVIAEGEGVELC